MVKANTPSPENRPPILLGMEVEGAGIQEISVDGRSFPYTIIRAGLAAPLPYGIGFLSDNLFISQEAPVEFRPFLLTHEIRHEKIFTDLPPVERCEAAVKLEVLDVFKQIPEQAAEYLAQRQAFYDALVIYYGDLRNSGPRGDEFVEGIKRARRYVTGKAYQFPVRSRNTRESFGLYEE